MISKNSYFGLDEPVDPRGPYSDEPVDYEGIDLSRSRKASEVRHHENEHNGGDENDDSECKDKDLHNQYNHDYTQLHTEIVGYEAGEANLGADEQLKRARRGHEKVGKVDENVGKRRGESDDETQNGAGRRDTGCQ